MRLKISRNAAEERLRVCLSEGYELRRRLWQDYDQLRQAESFDKEGDNKRFVVLTNEWGNKVVGELQAIFPTSVETHYFCDQPSWQMCEYVGMDRGFGRLYYHTIPGLIDRLKRILDSDLTRYTDLPIQDRLYIGEIDSFRNVRDVDRAMVAHALKDDYLDLSEDQVQLALEQIMNVQFHKKDWGGEYNDLYAEVIVNGSPTATAFLLKGHGLRQPELRIKDCGDNGDQLVRLFQSPAQLFVVQFVGRISEMVITDVAEKVKARRADGNDAHFLIIDGQDTARLLYAYNEL